VAVHVGADLVAETGGDLDQFDAAAAGLVAQFGQRLLDGIGRQRVLVGEQRDQLRDGKRLRRRQQGGFDDAADVVWIHGSGGVQGAPPSELGSGSRSAKASGSLAASPPAARDLT
jgi:hypothetical protein